GLILAPVGGGPGWAKLTLGSAMLLKAAAPDRAAVVLRTQRRDRRTDELFVIAVSSRHPDPSTREANRHTTDAWSDCQQLVVAICHKPREASVIHRHPYLH